MKLCKPLVMFCLGCAMLTALPQAQAAQQITQKQTEGQSLELTNLDEPDAGTEAAAPAATVNSPMEAAGATEPRTAASKDGKDTPAADTAASVAPKKAAETPLEKYRDAKLLQASTPNTVNPASARRYLKVDRATYLESAGLQ